MVWACIAANGTGSLVFIDDMTADKSSRMKSEVFRAILSAHIQPNASELIGWRFTVQMDNDPTHTAKATKEFFKTKKWNVMQWPSQSPDLNLNEHAFHLSEDNTEGKMPQEQAGTEDSCSRSLAEHHQGWNPASGDVYAFQTSGCNWLQWICNQVLKSEKKVWFMIVSLSHYLWSLKKWEAHIETVVIPTPFTWFGCKYPQMKAESTSCSFHFKSIVVVYRAKKMRIVLMSQYLWTWLYLQCWICCVIK